MTTFGSISIAGWFILLFTMKIWNRTNDEMRGCFVITAYPFLAGILYLVAVQR
jgi:hypothetical protein